MNKSTSQLIEDARAHLATDAIDIVLYHAGCTDGFAARWVAQRKLGDSCEYVPFYYYNPPPPDTLANKSILYVDCSPKPHELQDLIHTHNVTALVLDHHKTAKDAFRQTPVKGVFIDTSHCAAILAWYYFYDGETVPHFLRYIEDRDLWRWKHPVSRAFTASFTTLVPFEYDAYEKCMDEARCRTLIAQGKLILEYQTKRVATLARHMSKRKFWGYTVAMINCTETNLISDLGAELSRQEGIDFALLWYYNGTTRCIHVSLRSDGRVDVQKIASCKHLNGGGHPCAAGFVWFDRNIENLFNYNSVPSLDNIVDNKKFEIAETY